MTVVINFKLFNFSTSPPSILGCFAPSIIIGALIIFLRSHTPTYDRYNAYVSCHDSLVDHRGLGVGVGGGGLPPLKGE